MMFLEVAAMPYLLCQSVLPAQGLQQEEGIGHLESASNGSLIAL